ncbi:5-(carboxyamino)imidazole ribonucleotide synthase [Skermanella mucosa]|uniref:5-(carboxyamino)imidazole ribonucleotide synthase n=1 Tax=Skermanella mucosa TaxID=1789672 RepID=UPI00192B3CA3|nr:5-(carboxyamino)imidazole ribonucleotide synthase [Skermanella mucosa]UEM19465.1 5-(carboxyamino)imidazole ribonucleotide synthase [Skermanella mucosa]
MTGPVTGGPVRTVAPGGTIGMLGGGQLGRMTALAAARLGYRTHVYSPDRDSPCAQVSAAETVAGYGDHEALARFARSVDVVTLEWENIPVQTVAFLAKFVPVHPGPGVLAIAQDRLLEKDFVNRLGIATAPWRPARCPGQAASAFQEIGTPCVMKSARMGYDGKGQVKLTGDVAPVDAWKSIGGVDAIVEGFVDFALEISVIVARGQDGAMAAYPAVENRHADHILDETIAPAAVAPEIADEAGRIACRIAQALQFVGVLAVEMFVTRDGEVLVNEVAPRPHNSGHWTIDACAASQFEQLVRAVCGLPLGSVERTADAVMKNLIGSDVDQWQALLAEPGARLHLYGKAEARPGRKMGHVTRLVPLGSIAGP